MRSAASLFVAMVLTACGDSDAGEAERVLGRAGESCASRADCEAGLSCLAQVCLDVSDAGDAGLGARLPGAPCAARRDCAEGLLCVQNLCASAAMGTEVDGPRYSGRGESCRAQNDCQPELACVNETCREQMLSLEATGKQCVRVECESREDCCASFTPNENCDAYRENCETDPIFCNTYRNLCECTLDCIDELCMAGTPGCSTNEECTSQQTPFCVGGSCRQCESDGNCPGEGSQCVSGVCMSPCSVDENCPALHGCQEGECVEVGCRSDRECVFLQGDAMAVCRDGECYVPCETDTDCAGGSFTRDEGVAAEFEVCEDGRCRFVGCETDAECRAYLGLHQSNGQARAVCR